MNDATTAISKEDTIRGRITVNISSLLNTFPAFLSLFHLIRRLGLNLGLTPDSIYILITFTKPRYNHLFTQKSKQRNWELFFFRNAVALCLTVTAWQVIFTDAAADKISNLKFKAEKSKFVASQ